MLSLLPVLSPAMSVTTTSKNLSPFAAKALTIVSNHPIVKSNAYTEWFAEGDASIEQAQVCAHRSPATNSKTVCPLHLGRDPQDAHDL